MALATSAWTWRRNRVDACEAQDLGLAVGTNDVSKSHVESRDSGCKAQDFGVAAGTNDVSKSHVESRDSGSKRKIWIK